MISRLTEAGLRVCGAEVKDPLTDEHKSYHRSPAGSKVDHLWGRVTVCDESAFSTANGLGLDLLRKNMNIPLHRRTPVWSSV